jgi:hypothetical protein
LEYIEAAEAKLRLDRLARSASWLAGNSQLVREESVLGLKAYVWHRDLNDGWWEGTYSPSKRYTPLVDREYIGGVETTREAVSVQFRDVSPDEIAPPLLPVHFDRAEALEQALRSNDENRQTADGIAERMHAVRENLRSQGRTQ